MVKEQFKKYFTIHKKNVQISIHEVNGNHFRASIKPHPSVIRKIKNCISS